MKKYLPYIVFAVIAVAGYFLFQQTEPAVPGNKFFPPSEIKASDVVVKITDKGFEPSTLDIKRDQRVVFVNETSDFAWPASNPHPTHTIHPAFDPLEPLAAGEAWAFVFEEAGSWGMHDHLKPGKRGMIRVTD